MSTKSHVLRWGTSLAVRIPESVAERWDVREGSAVEIVVRGEAVVVRKPGYDLDTMLAEVRPNGLHAEVDTGDATGVEAW